MKKTLIVLGLVLGSVGVVNADCSIDPCGNGDPMAITMPWGLTGYQTPKIVAGASDVDEAGNEYQCPVWYNLGMGGCFDVPKTAYYKIQMKEVARSLGAGLIQFPHLVYWSR